jgi:hypothetical protein
MGKESGDEPVDMMPNDEAKSEEAKAVPLPVPPLQSAAQRLERLLSGKALDFYSNPTKVVRRWMGTSATAAGEATASDIRLAAAILLDPSVCLGRSLIVSGSEERQGDETTFLKSVAREIEAWLICLAVRVLWKEKKYEESLTLAQKGLELVSGYIEGTTGSLGSVASLFPLLARLIRWRSLVAEALDSPQIDAQLRPTLSKAHNIATVRRDVETQAVCLNCMLRDLIRYSQSKFLQNFNTTPLTTNAKLIKRKSFWRTQPSQKQRPIINCVVTYFTVAVFKLCVLNIPPLSLASERACEKHHLRLVSEFQCNGY